MWVPELRLLLINEAHPELAGAEGARLLAMAPAGIRERIRRGDYARSQYIHELIAETYALVMRERIQGRPGQPLWLATEIYQLIARIGT